MGRAVVEQADVVVIGAGVVGLATARALALAGREVLVLEAGAVIGAQTSSRNSEVIHAGLYYPQGSLKARLCVQGKQMLYAYCAERGIAHRRCGKLIVATAPQQMAQLQELLAQAAASGVDDLALLTREQARALEPALECVAAVHSPSTGVIDSHALMLSLQGDLEHAGGKVVFNSPMVRGRITASGIEIETQGGVQLRARTVVNAAGVRAPTLARCFEGLDARCIPGEFYAKGNYFALSGRSPFSRLIYPVPQTAGLGVHLTMDLGGQTKFGPDVQWVNSPDDLSVDPARGESFYAEVRKYWPALADGALQPGYAGIRPKISGPGEDARDFMIQSPAENGVPGLVNLFGIESPGLTSSLAIADEVLNRLRAA